MIITLRKILNGATSEVFNKEVIKFKGSQEIKFNEWYNEREQKITESYYLNVLNDPEVGKEMGALLLETRYQIIAIRD
ncbi:hypothetical protein GCM10027155_03560 [Acinetobacter apis]|uniref:Uncharacterized protein n=1 Tax=Acinetobacter apis TaxID=1229165 RepID=A0A217ED92_9GAMM|nr:hypothetical protein [Acinetobacter apis]SNQ28441.1 hypothetical protein SAMN05444584_0364 [Acinetobacter apis]